MVNHAVRDLPHLSRDCPEVRREALPLGWDAAGRLTAVTLGQTRDPHGSERLDSRRGDVGNGRRVHCDGFHDWDVVEMTLSTHLLGSQGELVPERAGEGLVRSIAHV